jgi:hypothetical protein
VAVVAVGSAVVANQKKQAAKGAAGAQRAAAEAGISEQERRFLAIQELLAPYVSAGESAIGAQKDLAGLSGNEAQKAAIKQLQESSQFQALSKQGEEAILQNAAATGGLRGGNTQGALLQFRPNMLAQLIEQQYGRLGQIAQLGQASAMGEGTAGLKTGDQIASLLGQRGQAEAGGLLARGAGNAEAVNGIVNAIGMYFSGGLSGAGSAASSGSGNVKKWW